MPFDVLNAYRKGPLGTSNTFRDAQIVSQEGAANFLIILTSSYLAWAGQPETFPEIRLTTCQPSDNHLCEKDKMT